MKIIVISHNKPLENEEKIIVKLFENGLDTFHLRKPRMSTRGLEELINKIPEHFHPLLVIHSHHKLAGKYKIKGIHFTKSHLNRIRTTRWKLRFLSFRRSLDSLTLSCSRSQLSAVYQPNEFNYDYIFLNPIFDPLTGKFQSGYHEDGLKAANTKSGKKIIARGGVDVNKIERIINLGFYGFALNSCIWKSNDPILAFQNIINECRKHGIDINSNGN